LCCVQESLTDLYLTNTQNTSLTKLTATIACYSSMSETNTIHYHSNTTVTDLAITYNANGGSGAPGTQYKTYNVPVSLRQTIPTREGYTFVGWNTQSDGSGHWFVQGQVIQATDNYSLNLYAIWDDTTPNVPVINSTYMKPVDWNGTAWVEVSEGNWGYNYNLATANTNTVNGDGTAKWANAIVDSDGDGTFESYYVWIPRYSYKISTIDGATVPSADTTVNVISWNRDDFNTYYDQGRIDIKFSNGTNDYVSNGYKVHPAFTFGDKELTGIWVAKYEMSMETNGVHTETSDTTIGNTLISSNPSVKMVSKPGVSSWRNILMGNAYTNVRNMNTDLDSHLMKNTEWGAVVYLTSGRGRVPYSNNSNAFITGSSGSARTSAASSVRYDVALGDNNTEFAYNTVKGVKGSTTHNIYGVYDMSGGAGEYVAYYLNTGNVQTYMTSIATDKNTKYVDLYTPNASEDGYTESHYGDAIYETSFGYKRTANTEGTHDASWDRNYSFAAYPWIEGLYRGDRGVNEWTSGIGMFAYQGSNGNNYNYVGFRAVITAEQSEQGIIALKDVPVGAYIEYAPSNETVTVLATDSGHTADQTFTTSSYTDGWKVFKNNDGQIDIISSESVGELTLVGATGYARLVYTLNKMSNDYVNSDYATSGRSLGSKVGSSMEIINTTTYPLTWENTYTNGNNGFPYTDTYYTSDKTILQTVVDGEYPLWQTSGSIWMASRDVSPLSTDTYFRVWISNINGGYSNSGKLYFSYSDGHTNASSHSYGVRPVVSLKSNIKIVSGDGTQANPYVLSL